MVPDAARGAMQGRLDRAEGAAPARGDLLEPHLAEMSEHEDLTLRRRQVVYRRLDLPSQIASFLSVVRRFLGGPKAERRLERDGGSDTTMADQIDTVIRQDTRRPGERVGVGTVAVAGRIDPHQRLLHGVQRVLVVPEIAAGQTVQSPLIAADERLEGPLAVAPDPVHEGEVIRLHTPSAPDPTAVGPPGFTGSGGRR